jgi:hypothetical protein
MRQTDRFIPRNIDISFSTGSDLSCLKKGCRPKRDIENKFVLKLTPARQLHDKTVIIRRPAYNLKQLFFPYPSIKDSEHEGTVNKNAALHKCAILERM